MPSPSRLSHSQRGAVHCHHHQPRPRHESAKRQVLVAANASVHRQAPPALELEARVGWILHCSRVAEPVATPCDCETAVEHPDRKGGGRATNSSSAPAVPDARIWGRSPALTIKAGDLSSDLPGPSKALRETFHTTRRP